MIRQLKDDSLINRVGGRFKFTALVQHRIRQLMNGDRPLIERQGMNDLEVAIEEITQGKIGFELDPEALPPEQRPAHRPSERRSKPAGRARAEAEDEAEV
jgi:DNA-directed RNA polymerase subunit omega